MTTSTCVRCGRPTPDGYADVHCRDRAAAQLAEIADMVPAARDIAYGLSANLSGSGGSGKPGSRLPLDLGATARCDSVANVLTTWARHAAEERGALTPFAIRDLPAFDPILKTARWLTEHLEWFRHRPECEEFLANVEAAVRVMRGIVRGPAAQRYLGPCGAEPPECNPIRHAPDCPEDCGMRPCEGDVYARDNAATGRCRTCGAEVSTAERQAWLDSEVRQHTYTAAEIADAYPIKANTIRQWLSRGLLVAHGQHQGRPLLNLGEVLDLAAADAARREEARAERARRKTQTEGAAA